MVFTCRIFVLLVALFVCVTAISEKLHDQQTISATTTIEFKERVSEITTVFVNNHKCETTRLCSLIYGYLRSEVLKPVWKMEAPFNRNQSDICSLLIEADQGMELVQGFFGDIGTVKRIVHAWNEQMEIFSGSLHC